jgi:hypothetical protein
MPTYCSLPHNLSFTYMLGKMLLRLYAIPLIILSIEFIALFFLGWFIPNQFDGSQLLLLLGQKAAGFAPTAFVFLCLVSLIWSLFSSYTFLQWYNGNSDICDHCIGIVTVKNGRHGIYKHCLACGKNRRLN